MPIDLVIEDGTAKPDANSYVSVSEVRLYASNRGITLDLNDDNVASQIILATDYLETFACKYQGERTSPLQALEWPRTGVELRGQPWPPDAIPSQLRAAQAQLVIAQSQGFVLQPNTKPQDYIVREKVGPIETEYADPTSVGMYSNFTAVEGLLAPLFGECAANKFTLRTIRV